MLAHDYRYLIVSRERKLQFQEAAASISTATGLTVHFQKVVSEVGQEARLYCFSEERQKKEKPHDRPLLQGFRRWPAKVGGWPQKPRCNKKKDKDKMLQRIGRLQ